jgi:hypothetical protein
MMYAKSSGTGCSLEAVHMTTPGDVSEAPQRKTPVAAQLAAKRIATVATTRRERLSG